MKIDNRHINYTYSPRSDRTSAFALELSARLSDVKKETLFSEFHSLLSSGVDFNRAFEMLIRGEKDKRMEILLKNLHKDVIRGDTLWQTLAKNREFSSLDYGVVRIGEETGKLYESLQFLSEYYHKKTAQRRMISSAVSYPVIVLIVAVIVLIFMILVIVPMFEQVYSRMGGELPDMTRAVIAFSRNFKTYLLVFSLVAIILAIMFMTYRNYELFQKWRTTLLLRVPLIGNLLKKHYQSHFCKLMYLLYSSGVPLLQGVDMLKGIITFYPYRKSFDTITQGLNNGESFADNIGKYPNLYDTRLSTLLKVGEETNTLSVMLKKQGDDLTMHLEHKLRQLGNMLEPILILFVGILVAIVLISMYMPMFKLGNTIY